MEFRPAAPWGQRLSLLFYLQNSRCSLIAYVFISNRGYTKILCTWFVYVLFKQIHSHFYFLLSAPPHSLPPSSCNLNTLCVNQWTLWERKSGRMGMSAPCSPVSCLSPGFCLSSLHLSYKTPDLSLAYYMYNHQKDSAIDYRLKSK